MRETITFNCLKCGMELPKSKAYIVAKPTRGKYCSRACSDASHAGSGNPAWKGGRRLTANRQYYSDSNRQLEHRVIAERALGKRLSPESVVRRLTVEEI